MTNRVVKTSTRGRLLLALGLCGAACGGSDPAVDGHFEGESELGPLVVGAWSGLTFACTPPSGDSTALGLLFSSSPTTGLLSAQVTTALGRPESTGIDMCQGPMGTVDYRVTRVRFDQELRCNAASVRYSVDAIHESDDRLTGTISVNGAPCSFRLSRQP